MTQQRLKLPGFTPPRLFDDPSRVPGIGLDPRFAGLVRLCGLGFRGKWIESRTMRALYRGPIVLCSTSGKSTAGDESFALNYAKARAEFYTDDEAGRLLDHEAAVTSSALAVANLVDCWELRPSDWPGSKFFAPPPPGKSKRWAWRLEGIWPLHPFEVRPTQGFFGISAGEVRIALIDWIAAQLDPTSDPLINTSNQTRTEISLFARALPALESDYTARELATAWVDRDNLANLWGPEAFR